MTDFLQFLWALIQVIGFFGGLFLIIFTVVIGSHAAVSKDPVEKNLSEEMLKKRLKDSVLLAVSGIISAIAGSARANILNPARNEEGDINEVKPQTCLPQKDSHLQSNQSLTNEKKKHTSKPILDGKGKLIGREVGNGVLLDGKGKLAARYIKSSNITVDGKGHKVGVGDQRLRRLGKGSKA